jgi:rhamnogalacturonyl hydrolase YesR
VKLANTLSSALLAGAFVFASAFTASAQGGDYFANWPKGSSPQEIGKAVAEHFVASPHSDSPTIHYAEIGTWYGALTFAQLTHDDVLRKRLIARFEPLMPGGAEAALRPQRHHVDDSIFGVVPFEIAIQTKAPKYLAEGKWWAGRQWESPTPDGLSGETRFWVDDMYMLTMLQLEAYRATGDRVYLDRDAKEMVAYLDKLQQPNGLFYHAPDSPFFWGRGNGWMAAGMAELLSSLPAGHPQRPRILEGYDKMMASLLKYQGADGLWRQLIDQPDFWPETSGTGMFTFMMISGVKDGWLDAKIYGPAARKGWLGLITFLNPDANLRDVCAGTNKSAQTVGPDLAVQLQYYKDRPRLLGDLHGQAPVLWSASELLR